MILDGSVLGEPLVNFLDTEANIEANHTVAGMIAVSNDQYKLGYYINSQWYWTEPMQVHDIVGSYHSVTGSQWDVVGLTGTDTLGLLTPSSNPGAAAALLRTDSSGHLQLVRLILSEHLHFTASTSHNIEVQQGLNGHLTIRAGHSSDSQDVPGDLLIEAGDTRLATTGTGGDTTIRGGTGNASSTVGGVLYAMGGVGSGVGHGGDAYFTGGTGGTATGMTGGDVYLRGGESEGGAGKRGDIIIGYSTAPSPYGGGHVYIYGGPDSGWGSLVPGGVTVVSGSDASGDGADIDITTGSGGDSGDLILATGTASTNFGEIILKQGANTRITVMSDGGVSISEYIEMTEITAPSAPAADSLRLYTEDVSGDTLLRYKTSAITGTIALLEREQTFTAEQTVAPSSGNAVVITGGTLANDGSEYWLNVSGTLPTTPTSTVRGARIAVTSAGSSSQVQEAAVISLGAGYTGSGRTSALRATNSAAGTGAQIISSGIPIGNAGMFYTSLAATAGYNYGTAGFARYGDASIGVIGRAGYSPSTSSKAAADYVGGLFVSRNTAAGGATNIGAYCGLDYISDPTFESTALLVDNADATVPVIIARDGGSAVFSVLDGGSVEIVEITAPSAPAANAARLYAEDVSGVTEMRARFSSGDVLTIALSGVTVQTYTPTNVTTDRSFNADSTTLDEVADVLGTLIADLQARKILS